MNEFNGVIYKELEQNKSDKAVQQTLVEIYRNKFAEQIKNSGIGVVYNDPILMKKPFGMRIKEWLKKMARRINIVFNGCDDGLE